MEVYSHFISSFTIAIYHYFYIKKITYTADMETFEPGIASAYSTHTFGTGEQGMKCLNPRCGKVMTMAEWEEKRKCFCQSTNAVPAIARSAPPKRLEMNRRTGLNSSNRSSNTPPRNPPTPTVNPRPTIYNPSSNSTSTTSSSSSPTTPSNSSRTQGSSLSEWIYGVAIVATVAIAAALSPGMSAWFTAQFSQFTNNSTTQKRQQPQLTPKEVVTRYYQLAASNRTQAKALLSDAFKEKYRQQNPNSTGKSEFWDSINRVEAYSFKTEIQSPSKHQIRVWLKYIYKNGTIKCESQILEVIFDSSKAQWLIDKMSDVKYNLDCGK